MIFTSIKHTILFILLCTFTLQESMAQVTQEDKIFTIRELDKCTKSSGVLSSEINADENWVLLKYKHWNTIIKIFKHKGKDPKTKAETAKYKIIVKYTIPGGRDVFDDLNDRYGYVFFLSEKLATYDLAISPFMMDAFYSLSDDIERGINVTKEPNGFTAVNKRQPFNGSIKLVVRTGKNGGVILYVEYDALIS